MTQPDGHHATDVMAIKPGRAASPITHPERSPIVGREREHVGKLFTLGRTEGFSNAPVRLSETGVFVDTATADLEASSGSIPYDVQSPLWSDGAEKQRWAAIPDGEAVTFSGNGNWIFPAGSVFVKHFALALDESQAELKRRMETRILVQGTNAEFYGLTYKWNEAGTDARLAAREAGRTDRRDPRQRGDTPSRVQVPRPWSSSAASSTTKMPARFSASGPLS